MMGQPFAAGATKSARTCFALLAALAAVLASPAGARTIGRQSTLITNVTVIDGTGSPGRKASVRILAGRIAAVGKLSARRGEHTVDGEGKVLAPGFIDTHSHHDEGLFEQPAALPVTTQGVTTIIVGQDGSSAAPLGAFLRKLTRSPVAVNVGTYIGHNTIRAAVLGDDYKRAATSAEVERMRSAVREGMKAGAIGLSTGLEYDPGIYSTKAEVLAVAKEAALGGGRYISHIRSEDQKIWPALDELVEVGRVTGMPVQISHMKLAMTDLWGSADKFIAVLERARTEGIQVSGDVYPYEYWQSTLTVMFPNRDFGNRKSAEFALQHLAPAEGLLLSTFSADPSLVGKTVADVAKMRGIDPPDALIQLIAESQVPGAQEMVIGTSMHPKDVARLIAWRHANISSDGMLSDRHPRGAGSFPRVFRVYVREQKLLTLEQAVHKMTEAAAHHMGISDRGVIRPGARADLVLFDPDRISDRATSQDPAALSVGVEHVWVNGTAVLVNGRATAARPGQPILRSTRTRPRAMVRPS